VFKVFTSTKHCHIVIL